MTVEPQSSRPDLAGKVLTRAATTAPAGSKRAQFGTNPIGDMLQDLLILVHVTELVGSCPQIFLIQYA